MRVVILTLVFFLAIPVYSAEYYVAPGGHDGNPGTATQPWKTITKAANTVVAGDVVNIKAGRYHERLKPVNSGTSGKHITFRNHNNDKVILDGKGVSVGASQGLVDIRKKSHIVVDGLRIENVLNTNDSQCVRVEDSQDIDLKNLYTGNCWSSGILAKDSENIRISQNEIVNSGHTQPKTAIQECISVIRTNNAVVSNNHVHNCGKESIDIKRGASNVSVFGNLVHDGKRAGIYLDGFDEGVRNIKVYGNHVHDVDWFAFGVASEQAGFNQHLEFFNNIGTHSHRCFILADWDNHPDKRAPETHKMDDIKFINNTCYRNKKGGIRIKNYVATNVVVRNNIASENENYQISLDPKSKAKVDYNLIYSFQNFSDEVRGVNYVEGDPKFVNASSGDFRLQKNSPAIDAGIDSSAPSDDFDGNKRVGVDIGALEHGSSGGSTDDNPDGSEKPSVPANLQLNLSKN